MTEEHAKIDGFFVYLNDFGFKAQNSIPFFRKEGYTETC